jgi:LytS/YehU family sensor histidine kinase
MRMVCRELWRRQVPILKSAGVCVLCALLAGSTFVAVCVGLGINAGGTVEPAKRWPPILAGALGCTVLLVTWSALYFSIKQQARLDENRQSLANAAIALRDAQLAALQYQLQPHFLFNSLNAISTLVFEGNRVDAGMMISRLADLLRSTLESIDEPVVYLETELNTARQYLAIEEVRFGPRLQVIVDVEPQALATRVPRFILQPLLENAIRHGVSKRLDGGRIWLSAQVRNGFLRLSVMSEGEDNQMDSDGKFLSDNGFGFGLANTRKRLLHSYGSGATIVTNQRPQQMFEVILSIPVPPDRDLVKE